MQASIKFLLVCAAAMVLNYCGYASNPLITSTYTADPSPHRWSDGKYYLYCSHDKDEDVDWNMEDYHVFSSTNLIDWKDNGIAYKNTDSSWKGALWAPDCAEKNGKYYLYFPQGVVIGVAVSTNPVGYFKDSRILYSGPTNSSFTYDPMVFTDDDGQCYLVVSSAMKSGGFKPVLVKLGEDMVSVTEETILTTSGNFHEGPWMFKRNGLYYLTWGGGDAQYSTSTNLKGPYTYRGTICNQWRDAKGNLIKGDQQHPAVVCFSNQWYFASAWGAPDNKRRQVFMENLYFNPDGSIRFIEPTMEGVVPGRPAPALLPPDPYKQMEAENFSSQSGVGTETCSDNGGLDVGWISNGDFMVYSNLNFTAGASGFQARVSSANNGGNIEIRLDGESGPLVGTCEISSTGSWQTWVTKSCKVDGISGTHAVYLKFTGGNGDLFNINWFKFIAKDTNSAVQSVSKP